MYEVCSKTPIMFSRSRKALASSFRARDRRAISHGSLDLLKGGIRLLLLRRLRSAGHGHAAARHVVRSRRCFSEDEPGDAAEDGDGERAPDEARIVRRACGSEDRRQMPNVGRTLQSDYRRPRVGLESPTYVWPRQEWLHVRRSCEAPPPSLSPASAALLRCAHFLQLAKLRQQRVALRREVAALQVRFDARPFIAYQNMKRR